MDTITPANDRSEVVKSFFSQAALPEFSAALLAELTASDPQFRAALPDSAVEAEKCRADFGLAQIVASVMEGYRDRPALGQRATEVVTDPATGRRERRVLDHFDTVTYGELWSRARALATRWFNDAARPAKANDLICVIGTASIDYTTIYLASVHNGVVYVPIQTNAPLQQLQAIVEEILPNWLASSVECLNTSVELVLTGHRPKGLLLFDYHPELDAEREIYEEAKARLTASGLPDLLVTFQAACATGEALAPAPLFAEPDTRTRLSAIYYTSGSTGLPKGVMYPERNSNLTWQAVSILPNITVHYMPMNHLFGPSTLYSTLAAGGTCYFTAKSDLSTLFEDIRLVRPTRLSVIPRLCEMIHQRFDAELSRRAPGSKDVESLTSELKLEFRKQVLGGRLLTVFFAAAPLSAELRQFMSDCLGFPMDDTYGATECSAVLRNSRILQPPVLAYKLDDVPELGYYNTDKPYPRGEIRVRTSNIMLGYYKRPELTAAMFDEEGFYKSGDIMAQTGPDQFVYVDRRNNVLKLSQGEFVAISHLEAQYSSGHPLISQIYLYGTSLRSFLLAVVVPNETAIRDLGVGGDEAAVKAALRDAIKQVARAEQLNSYEVPRDFIVEHEPFSPENGMLTSSSKYSRPSLKERYGARLEALYEAINAGQADELLRLRRDGRNAPVLETVTRAVQATLGIEDIDLSDMSSFIELGGDSLSALSCSLLLEEIFEVEVPAGVIGGPAGSLQQLARYIERARGEAAALPTFAAIHGRGATELHASDLTLEKFLDAKSIEAGLQAAAPSTEVRTVLITGANGYLGRFLCLEWLQRMAKTGGKVVCIARGRDAAEAWQRVADAFDSGDAELKAHFQALAARHLEVLAGDLAEPHLGLGQADWRRLAETVDLIVHPAALVNHVLPYAQLFGPNVVGTAELIRLAISHHLKPFNNVSTMAVATIPGGAPLNEDADVRVATPIRRLDGARYADGYANSKWAAEVLLRNAHDRFGLPVSVYRSDMIMAHSRYRGQINVPDIFTRWLFSVVVTGLAPRSFYTADTQDPHYDGLPVDFTAESIVTIGLAARSGFRTYHVVNPHEDGISQDSFVDWAIEAGYPIVRIDDYADWLARFETALRALPEKQRQQSVLPLLHHLRAPQAGHAGASISSSRFHADVRAHGIGPERDIPRLSQHFIRKYLDDIRAVGLL